MAKSGTSRDYRGWSARGRARAERAAARNDEIDPILPDRVSTLELGQLELTYERDGCPERGKGDDLVKTRLIERALAGDFKSVQRLYRELDEEEDRSLTRRTRPVSPKMKKEMLGAISDILKIVRDQSNELITEGLAVVHNGRLQVEPEIIARFRTRRLEQVSD